MVLVGGMVVLVSCFISMTTWRTSRDLRNELASLREALAEVPQLKEQIAKLSQSQQEQADLARSGVDHTELMRLRGEIGLLKQLMERANSRVLPGWSAPDQPLGLPREGWTNAGSSTWAAGVQSFMWAARENNYSELKEMSWVPPNEEAEFEKDAGKFFSLAAQCRGIKVGLPRYTRLDGRETLNGDLAISATIEVVFDGLGDEKSPRWEQFKLRRIDNGWKYLSCSRRLSLTVDCHGIRPAPAIGRHRIGRVTQIPRADVDPIQSQNDICEKVNVVEQVIQLDLFFFMPALTRATNMEVCGPRLRWKESKITHPQSQCGHKEGGTLEVADLLD